MKLSETSRDQLKLLMWGTVGGIIFAIVVSVGYVINERIGGMTTVVKHSTAVVVNKAESAVTEFNVYRDSIKGK